MVEKLEWEPDVILNGGMIQHIQYGRLIFRDTLNFFNAPLSALPKMMAIDGAKKGYFPHFFNNPENQDYVGEIPPMKYYGVDEFRSEQRAGFITWWESEKAAKKIFNFKDEMLAYCRSDVEILRKASLKFRELYIQMGGIDPLEKVTIAGACMQLYRTNFLQKDLVGIMPHQGYRAGDKHSIEAMKWLRYMEHEHQIKISTAQDGPEVKIGGHKVDGHCDNFRGKPTIFEYHVSNNTYFLLREICVMRFISMLFVSI